MSIFNFQAPKGRYGIPFRELDKMRNHMETIYNSLSGGVANIRKNLGVFPLVNLAEDDNFIYLTAELPGAVPDSLEATIKGNTLSLKGQINSPHTPKPLVAPGADDPTASDSTDPKSPEAPEEISFHRKERENGTFRRVVTLPLKVDANNVEASYKNGILTVTMPKAAESKSHSIPIKNQ